MVSAPRPQEILRNVSIVVDGRVCGFGVLEAFVLDNISSLNVEFREGLALRNDAQLSNILTPPNRSSVVFKHHASNNNEVNDENHVDNNPERDRHRSQSGGSDHHDKENSRPTVRERSSEKKQNPFTTPARRTSSPFSFFHPPNPKSCAGTITPKGVRTPNNGAGAPIGARTPNNGAVTPIGARTPATPASTCTTPRNLESEENREYERLLQNSGKMNPKVDSSDRHAEKISGELDRGKKVPPKQRKPSLSKKSKSDVITQGATTPKRKKSLDPEVLPTPVAKPTQKGDEMTSCTPSRVKRRSGSFSSSTPAIPPKRCKEESQNNPGNTIQVAENVQNTPKDATDDKLEDADLSPQFSDEDGNLSAPRYSDHRPAAESSMFHLSSHTESQDQQYKRMMKSDDSQKLIQSEGFWL